MINIRDHGGLFGGAPKQTVFSYIEHTNEVLANKVTATNSIFYSACHDKVNSKYYVLRGNNYCIDVYNENFTLLYTVSFTSSSLTGNNGNYYPKLIRTSNGRIYLTGNGTNSSGTGYPFICEISISSSSITTLKGVFFTDYYSSTYPGYSSISPDGQVISIQINTGSIIHYDLNLNLISGTNLNAAVDNNLYNGDIRYDLNLYALIQNSNGVNIIRKISDGSTVLTINNTNSSGSVKINDKYIFVANVLSGILYIYDRVTYSLVSQITLAWKNGRVTSPNFNDDYIMVISPNSNKACLYHPLIMSEIIQFDIPSSSGGFGICESLSFYNDVIIYGSGNGLFYNFVKLKTKLKELIQ